jgi:ribosomal protein S14
MGIFGKKSKLPRNSKFDEAYLLQLVNKVVWDSEVVQVHDFFIDGNDPGDLKDGFPAKPKNEHAQMLCGTPYSFLCLTNWRILVGWIGTGIISSFPYDAGKFEILNDENGLNLRFTKSHSKPKNRHEVSTYQVSKDFANAVENLKLNKRPKKTEFTDIEVIEEDWAKGSQHAGHELIAKMAQKAAGTAMAEVAVCSKCGNRTGSPRSFPKGYFDMCRICLRENVSN